MHRYVFVQLNPRLFHVFGFIDCTHVRTCRVGSGQAQQAFYSRYFRAHGLKYLVVVFPNGMVGLVYGSSLNTNDNGMLNLSGLNDYLTSILSPVGQHFPALYGDGIFALLATITGRYRHPTEREKRINAWMASLRECIEHVFAQYFNLFHLLCRKEQFRLLQGRADFKLCIGVVTFFILNCYTCLNGSPVNEMFGTLSPEIEDYIPLGEELQEEPLPPPPAKDFWFG